MTEEEFLIEAPKALLSLKCNPRYTRHIRNRIPLDTLDIPTVSAWNFTDEEKVEIEKLYADLVIYRDWLDETTIMSRADNQSHQNITTVLSGIIKTILRKNNYQKRAHKPQSR